MFVGQVGARATGGYAWRWEGCVKGWHHHASGGVAVGVCSGGVIRQLDGGNVCCNGGAWQWQLPGSFQTASGSLLEACWQLPCSFQAAPLLLTGSFPTASRRLPGSFQAASGQLNPDSCTHHVLISKVQMRIRSTNHRSGYARALCDRFCVGSLNGWLVG